MLEVFKTNIQDKRQATIVKEKIFFHFPECKLNFDFEDCDKILRVEGASFCTKKILEIVCTSGFFAEVLE